MNILFVTSEAVPFAKSGGLADVAGSLPKVLLEKGIDVRVIMPYYRDIHNKYGKQITSVCKSDVSLGWRSQCCHILKTEYDNVTYYFIRNDYYFFRDDLYGEFDDGERFLFFSKAVLDSIPNLEFWPDILHLNDWQTGIIPFLLNRQYKKHYKDMKTVFTIHNIKYQGRYGKDTIKDILGLEDEDIDSDIEFKGHCNIMKSAIYNANWVNTVSPSYAKELQFSYFGEDLEGVVQENFYKFSGILNGIDYDSVDPSSDKNLYVNYTRSLIKKNENKKRLIEDLGMEYDENRPLVGIVSRLIELKGLDLISYVGYEMMNLGINFVLLGTGDKHYEDVFKNLKESFPNTASVNITFSNEMASRIYAASDIILMPSRVEPCGLTQIIALRYGAIPLVRNTGGLGDTISKFNEKTLEGNGFVFNNYNAHEMLKELSRAVNIYKKRKENWNRLVANAFKSKFDWTRSAKNYIEIYEKIR